MGQNVSHVAYDSNGYPVQKSNTKLTSKQIQALVKESELFDNSLLTNHPEWLRNSDLHILANDMKLQVTFINEGAGYLNSLGYYVYETKNPPSNPSEIKEIVMIWANASAENDGGSFKSGDTFDLAFKGITDPITKVFKPTHEKFPSGYSVGFVLVANGWDGSEIQFLGSDKWYGYSAFNVETAPTKKYHLIPVLCESLYGSILYGVEDLNREGGSDDDFNDLLFMVKTSGTCGICKNSYGIQNWDPKTQGSYEKHRQQLFRDALTKSKR